MCRFRGRCSTLSLCEPPCADFVAGAALCEPPCADVVAGAALCEPPCADFVAGAALCEPPCADFVAGAALCEPPCADFVAGAALCEPPCADFVAGTALFAPPRADFVAGAIQNALWRDSERTKCCIFQWNRWLRSWQVKVCGTTVARRSRVILGSFSGMVGIVPPLGLEFSLVS